MKSGAELVVHRHVVDEEVRQPHHVLAPRQQHGQHRGRHQGPLQRPFHHDAAHEEEEEHERAHVDRAGRHGLFAEVLRQRAVQPGIARVGLLHRRLVLRQGDGAATLVVGHEQRPRLADAVAPLRDVVAVQPAAGVGLLGAGVMRQLTGAAHRFLAVRIGVIEVREVDGHAHQSGDDEHARGPHELRHPAFAPCLHAVGNGEEEHDEQEVVGHLQVVGHHLQGGEQGRHAARQQPAAVDEHHAAYRGRDVGQGDEFPDVSGGDEDEEVGREGPQHAADARIPRRDAKGPQQDVEAQHHDERQVDVVGQKELVDALRPGQGAGGVIRGGNLVRGHAAEHRVGPAGAFARALVVFLRLVAGAGARLRVVLEEDASLRVRREEVDEGQQREGHDDENVGKKSFHVE